MCNRFEEDSKFLTTVAHKIISYIPSEEQHVARKWVDKLSSYSSQNVDMARTRNDLLQEVVDILRRELYFRVIMSKRGQKFDDKIRAEVKRECDRFGEPNSVYPIIETVFPSSTQHIDFMTLWSPDKRTYMAAKPIGGKGTLIYMAVTSDPDQGWDLPDPSISPNLCFDRR